MPDPFGLKSGDIPKSPVQEKKVNSRRVKSSPLDGYVQKIISEHPDIPAVRIKGRCQALSLIKIEDIISWGQRNMEPLQNASNIQAEISEAFIKIDAVNWLQKTMEASCKAPSFLEKLTAKKPEHYEAKINSVRDDLVNLLAKTSALKDGFAPEVDDLNLDLIALSAFSEHFSDDRDRAIVDNRIRTLMAANQTGMMLLQVLDNAITQCSSFIQQIDSILTFTLPQWKLGNYGK